MRDIFSRIGRRLVHDQDPVQEARLRPASQPARRLVIIVTMVACVAFVACRDLFVAPHQDQHAQTPVELKPGDANTTVYPKESPATVTMNLVINDTDGSGGVPSGWQAPTYPFTTIVKAVAAGTITRTPLSGLGSSVTTYGPVGATGLAWTWGGLNTVNFNDADTKYVTFQYQSAGVIGSSVNYPREWEQNFGPNHIWCGLTGYPLCATFSGSRTITLTRLESSLNLVADSTNVAPGSTVTFTAKANPAVVEGQTIPVQVDSADWKPDGPPAGEAYDSTMSCGFGLRGYTCQRHIIGSGTFHVVAYVNGKRQEGSVHITTPSLTLTANPVAVHAGANVTFTPLWSDGRSTVPDMWQWTWTADHPPGHTFCGYTEDPCTKPVQETGTMKVWVRRNTVDRFATARVVVYTDFTLEANRSAVHAGDSVTFTPKYDGVAGPAARWRFAPSDTSVHDNVACANGVSPCRKAMVTTGKMWVYTATSGGDSASALVTVVAGHITLSGGGSFHQGDMAAFQAGKTSGTLVVTDWFWDPGEGAGPNRLPRTSPRLRGATSSLAHGIGSSRNMLGTSAGSPCSPGAESCSDTVAASGRMWVFGTVDGAADSAKVPVTLVATINVVCTPNPLVRAASTSCTASASGGAPVITRWHFHPDDPDNVVSDVNLFDNPGPITWSGQMAISGTVDVEGTVNGVTGTGSTAITVQPRTSWPYNTPGYATEEVPNTELPIRPDSASKLGRTKFDAVVPAEAQDSITGGPNNGMYFMKTMHNEWERIQINRAALDSTTDFIQAQGGQYCSKSVVRGLVPNISRHEGMQFEDSSHTHLFKLKLNTLDLKTVIEAIVGDNGGISSDRVFVKTNALREQAVQFSKRADSTGTNNFVLPCTINFNY